MRGTFCIVICCLIAFVVGDSCLSAEDKTNWWPQFRGPNGQGIGQGERYPTELDVDGNAIWKVKLPSGVSSPCIWGNRIFLTAHDKDRSVLETICVDRSNGEILWRHDAPCKEIEKVHEVSSPANATPATDGKRVFSYFASFGLLCYDIEGNEQWNLPLPMRPSRFGSGTSPIVIDDVVILNRDAAPQWNKNEKGDWVESTHAHILAVSAVDGSTVWNSKRAGGNVKYSSPVVWRDDQAIQILLMGSNRLTSYDFATGKEKWWVEGLPPQVCATPQVVGDRVYVTATGMFGEPETFLGLPSFDELCEKCDKNMDQLVGLDEIPDDLLVVDRRASGGAGNSPLTQFAGFIDSSNDKEIDGKEWKKFSDSFGGFMNQSEPGVYAIRLGGEGDASKTNIDWHAKKGVAEVPSPLIVGDRMFLVRNGGIVHCRDVTTGKDIYRGRLGAIGGYYASPVFADGKVYFSSDRGVVTVIDAASEKLRVLAKNDLEQVIMATPAMVEGHIYLRTDDHLYAFGL